MIIIFATVINFSIYFFEYYPANFLRSSKNLNLQYFRCGIKLWWRWRWNVRNDFYSFWLEEQKCNRKKKIVRDIVCWHSGIFCLNFANLFFFFKQKTAYEIASCLVGSEMCIRDRSTSLTNFWAPLVEPGCNERKKIEPNSNIITNNFKEEY